MFINSTKSVCAAEGSYNTPEEPPEWLRLGEHNIAHLEYVIGGVGVLKTEIFSVFPPFTFYFPLTLA